VRLQSFNLDDHPLQAEDHVEITLATVSSISIVEFILTTKFKFFRMILLDLFGCKTITFAGILATCQPPNFSVRYNLV
jgi:hypothetical protein